MNKGVSKQSGAVHVSEVLIGGCEVAAETLSCDGTFTTDKKLWVIGRRREWHRRMDLG